MLPMLATPGALPRGPEWLYEVMWDGMRLLADVAEGRVRLTSRSGRDVTACLPELADLPKVAPDVLLDGEVVLVEDGVPSFGALAERMQGPAGPRVARLKPVTFMVFDVLRLYGVPLLERPFEERRGTLERLDLSGVPALALSPIYTDGAALLAATHQQRMAGVVAKRRDGAYVPGGRSERWTKVSHRLSQSCVVGGWRERGATAGRIGGLLLGLPGPGGLRYAGRLTTGLAGESVQRVLRERLVPAERSPFTGELPRIDAAGALWCEPLAVVEVAHVGRDAAGRLLRPVYRGVRDDLDPAHVHVDD